MLDQQKDDSEILELTELVTKGPTPPLVSSETTSQVEAKIAQVAEEIAELQKRIPLFSSVESKIKGSQDFIEEKLNEINQQLALSQQNTSAKITQIEKQLAQFFATNASSDFTAKLNTLEAQSHKSLAERESFEQKIIRIEKTLDEFATNSIVEQKLARLESKIESLRDKSETAESLVQKFAQLEGKVEEGSAQIEDKLEKFSDTSEATQFLAQKLDKFEERLEILQEAFTHLQKKTDSLEQRLAELFVANEQTEKLLNTLSAQISTSGGMNNELSEALQEQHLAIAQSLRATKERIEKCEKDLSSEQLEDKVSTICARVLREEIKALLQE